MTKLCSVAGCQQAAHARSYCNRHYKRWLIYGSPTGGGREQVETKELLRFVDRAARYNGDACLLWPYPTPKHGYGRITQNGRRRLAHVVVCEIVHGPPPFAKAEAAHSCGNPGCLTPAHLRWDSHGGNMADRLIHGTDNRGERHGLSKLTANQVLAIRSSSDAQRKLAAQYGVSRSYISQLRNGHRWSWLEPS